MLHFNLQLFGGKGGSTTTVQGRDLTPDEIRLIKAQADAAEAFQPNILRLNQTAGDLLYGTLGTVPVDFNTMNNDAQSRINTAINGLYGMTQTNENAITDTNNALNDISRAYGEEAARNYGLLSGLADRYETSGNKAANAFDRYIAQNDDALTTAEKSLLALQNGELPSAYRQNMEDTIKSVLKNTIGENVNNLAQRGVLNSSVTNSALNAIESNAATAVAQNYLQNLNTVGNFANQRFQNSGATTGANASLTAQQLGNMQNTLNSLGNVYGQQYANQMGALGQQANLAQQQAENKTNVNSQNAGIYGNLVSQATAPITAAAGAQEAAQAPARNLWDASMGLTSSNNGTLAAIAGAQPQSQTTTTSGGGGFWGGLLDGAATVFCFPKGTMVHMAGGEKKDIADIVVGDEVIDKDGKTAKVILLLPEHSNEIWKLITKNGAIVRTTSTQPFFLEDGSQKELRYLTPDDTLMNMGEIISIERDGYERVYDFETDGDNNYIVNGGFVAQGGGVEWWKG